MSLKHKKEMIKKLIMKILHFISETENNIKDININISNKKEINSIFWW